MLKRASLPDTAQTGPYNAGYYLQQDGQPRNVFGFDLARDTARAQAIVEAAEVPPGGRILDFGCGLGGMTAAFYALGFEVVGVDPSPHAVENALPEARGLVHHLGRTGLSEFPDGSFDLVFLKDVFEHIDEVELHDLVDELMCIGRKVLSIIPVTDSDRKFIFEPYEDDPTHINRLTKEYWLGFFPYTIARDLPELTAMIRRPDKVEGTLSLLLAEPDPAMWRFIRRPLRRAPSRWSRLTRQE